jgi:hypothetical protein
MDTTLTEDEVAPFVETANLMVTAYLARTDQTADALREVETYLAAHFVSLRDRLVKSEAAGGVRFDYQGETGMGLDSSHYGQTAKLLDSSGVLKEIDGKTRITWKHRAGSERTNTDYRTLLPDVDLL